MNELRQSMVIKSLGKKVFFNLVSIADHIYFDEQFGPGALNEKMFGENTDPNETMEATLFLAWYLMDEQSREAIKDARITRPKGFDSIEVEFNTPEEKLKAILQKEEFKELMACVVATFMASSPDQASNMKKKIMAVKS